MEQRFVQLQQRMAQLGIDAYYCRMTSDIRWLTGFAGVFDTEQAHLALATRLPYPDGLVLHTDGRYSQAMRQNPLLDGFDVSDQRVSHAVFAARFLAEHLGPVRAAAGVTAGPDDEQGPTMRIGIEETLPLCEYRTLCQALSEALEPAGAQFQIVECADPIVALREVKDADEVALMRRAQQITDDAFADLLGWVAPGMTEQQVANELEYRMRALGATGLAFATICASGPNSALPHAVPSQRQLQAGDLVVLDFGARYGDYCSDMTRTIAIGKPDAEKRRIYDTVLEAHQRAKALIAPGVVCKDVHQLAEQVIAQAGFEGCFTHSLGHGVGIDIHEMPTLSARNDSPLVPGNVVTVEPGIYVGGFAGVRIEDYGVVTATGFDDFTASPHQLQVV